MTSPSRTTLRNATLRTTLSGQWPQVKWAVRNGQRGWAYVTWEDGPAQHDVAARLDTLSPEHRYPWGVDLIRIVSDELLAVAYWRSRQLGGCPHCLAVARPAASALLPPDTGMADAAAACVRGAQHVDAASLTESDRAAARAVLAVTGERGGGPAPRSEQLARTVTLFGHVVEALLT